MNETKTERVYLLITHLPTGTAWESVLFGVEKKEELHELIYSVDGKMHFNTVNGNRVYLPAKVLEQCSVELRSIWS